MATYSGTFTVGFDPDATFTWSESEWEDSGTWYMQISCYYGGGNNTDNTASTIAITWGASGWYDVTPQQDNPDISVTGQVYVAFDQNCTDDYAVTFTGNMTLTDVNQIGATGAVVVAHVDDGN